MITISRRYLNCSSRRLNAVSDLYAKLLTRPHFSKLEGDIPKSANADSLYSVSRAVVDSLNKSSITNEDKAKIHNDMIESLVHTNYGISNLHLNELRKLNQKVAPGSLIALIRSNPGRVDSSWDLFLKYTDPAKAPSDDAIVEVMKKVIHMENSMTEEESSGLDIREIAQVVLLLTNIQDKSTVKEDILVPLFEEVFSKKLTSLLPIILEHQLPVQTLLEKLPEGTDKQIFNIIQNIPVNDIISNELLLFKSLNYLHPNSTLENTEDETKNHQLLLDELERLKSIQFLKPAVIPEEDTSLTRKSSLFNEIVETVQSQKLDENNLNIALKLIRIYGMELGDIKTALDLYHNYLIKYVSHSEDLMYEIFLTLSYQAFKTGTSQLHQYAEAFIPAGLDINDRLFSNILRVTILTKSKSDVEDSLALYNSRNQQLQKDANETTLMSQFDEVTEALILAFLYNNDVEFARVILEGAMGQKLFSGSTATKAIKSHLALYGDAVETGTQKEVMEQRILNYMKHL